MDTVDMNKMYNEVRDMCKNLQVEFVIAKQLYPSSGHPSWLPKPNVIIIDYISKL